MSKVYIYRGKDDIATIYYSKEYVDTHNIPVFEYEGDIPTEAGVLKTDGVTLYREVPTMPTPEPASVTTDDILNTLLGVTE